MIAYLHCGIKFISNIHIYAEWVGDMDSENAGRLGLWRICQRDETSDNCQRQLTDFLSLSSVPFKVIIHIFFPNGIFNLIKVKKRN